MPTKTSRRRKPAAVPAARAGRKQPQTAPPTLALDPVPASLRPAADVALADAADRAADIVDLAREQAATIQSAAEAAAARTVAATHDRVATMLSDAQARAAVVADDADQSATVQRVAAADRLAAARSEAKQLLADARDHAEMLVRKARAQVTDLAELAAADREATATAVAGLRRLAEADLAEISALVDQRRIEAGQILARAQEQADELVAAAQREVNQARERFAQLAATAAEQYDGRRAEAEALYADAVKAADDRRREADQHVAAAHTEAERARTELREKLREFTDQFDTEAATKRKALADELAGLKQACDKQRERLREEAKTVAQQLREAAQKEADRITEEAQRKAKGVTDRAQADEARARRLLEEAREAKRANSRFRGWQQNISRKAWKTAPWIALAAGVGLAASGEYELARMVGINEYVAPLLPVSIDVYCVTAFRAKRDIPAALALMASANVTYHLAEQAHLVKEGQSAPWQLTTFVVLIFVAVIWRVHALMHDDAGTDGHAGTDTVTDTDRRTSTAARTDTSAGTQHPRTGLSGTDSYGAVAGTPLTRTEPVHSTTHHPAPAGANTGVTSTYSHRTSAVQATPNGVARTSTEHAGRTSAATYEGGTRTSTVTARTAPADGVPIARTSTTEARPRTNGAATAGRTGTTTPARTDAELLPLVQALPRETDGFVNISRVRTQLGVNQPRAIRLLKEAGLLRPEDADKYLA
ncbi:hypothetical protein [Streptomyces sp. IBSBF 2806]|uniref:hypothetical protein n=1 Tax=Streptomyces sp. IBSBF 2806 TaxID=2903529 RepID=UPI002FDBBDAD